MEKRILLILFCSIFFQMGTTYVIKEGDVEVGRYEEADGKTDIKEIAGNAPKPLVMKKKTATVYNNEGGFASEQVETGRLVPDKKETWTIEGRMLDLISAKPLTDGKIRLLSPEGNPEIKVSWNGMFSGKVPKLNHKKFYQFAIEPASGYTDQFLIFHSGQLAKLSSEQRFATAQRMGKQPLVHINNHYVDLEIAVLPANAKKKG